MGIKRGPFIALLRESPEEAAKIKKDADSIFFNSKAVKVLRQRAGLEIDEQWDIFKAPTEEEDEWRIAPERADQLKELISVVLTSAPEKTEIKYIHQQLGISMTPVRTPRANSSRGISSRLSSSMSRSVHDQGGWSPRVHS